MNNNIPVVILCGDMGTRLAKQTTIRPKPLVEIGGNPILWHMWQIWDTSKNELSR